MTSALELRALSLGFGERTLLEGVEFDVPARGITALLGPAGVGKSTLLRMLARRAELLPSFWWRGAVRFGGRDLLQDVASADARRRVALFGQKARLHIATVLDNVVAAFPGLVLSPAAKRGLALEMLDRAGLRAELADRLDERVVALPLGLQRRLSLARIAATDPAVLMADEPTRDVSSEEARAIEAMLVAEARRRAVLLITHDLAQARRIAAQAVVVVAGRQRAVGSIATIFAHRDPLVRRFVETGNAWPTESPIMPVAPEPRVREPASFRWLVPGQLGGTARPGLLNDEADDLAALRDLGVDTLVSLELTPFPPERLAGYGIAGLHLPIVDMAAPTVAAAREIVATIDARTARGGVTVYHCKAGLGRTGTMLGAHLIARGLDSLRALEELRTIQPYYVQSIAQEEFLVAFEQALHAAPEPGSGPR